MPQTQNENIKCTEPFLHWSRLLLTPYTIVPSRVISQPAGSAFRCSPNTLLALVMPCLGPVFHLPNPFPQCPLLLFPACPLLIPLGSCMDLLPPSSCLQFTLSTRLPLFCIPLFWVPRPPLFPCFFQYFLTFLSPVISFLRLLAYLSTWFFFFSLSRVLL